MVLAVAAKIVCFVLRNLEVDSGLSCFFAVVEKITFRLRYVDVYSEVSFFGPFVKKSF